jgi:hypothetical protein
VLAASESFVAKRRHAFLGQAGVFLHTRTGVVQLVIELARRVHGIHIHEREPGSKCAAERRDILREVRLQDGYA